MDKGICHSCGHEDYLYDGCCKECNLYYTQGERNKEFRDKVNEFYDKINKKPPA